MNSTVFFCFLTFSFKVTLMQMWLLETSHTTVAQNKQHVGAKSEFYHIVERAQPLPEWLIL